MNILINLFNQYKNLWLCIEMKFRELYTQSVQLLNDHINSGESMISERRGGDVKIKYYSAILGAKFGVLLTLFCGGKGCTPAPSNPDTDHCYLTLFAWYVCENPDTY